MFRRTKQESLPPSYDAAQRFVLKIGCEKAETHSSCSQIGITTS